jgi:hypothetical protein
MIRRRRRRTSNGNRRLPSEVPGKSAVMNRLPLHPLQFAPIYQYRPWGGRRLANLLSAPLPGWDTVRQASLSAVGYPCNPSTPRKIAAVYFADRVGRGNSQSHRLGSATGIRHLARESVNRQSTVWLGGTLPTMKPYKASSKLPRTFASSGLTKW